MVKKMNSDDDKSEPIKVDDNTKKENPKDNPENKEKESKPTKSSKDKTKEMVAIIRVRGGIRVKKSINDTLTMLKLYRVNCCVVYEKTPSIMGMIQKAKDYITWGDIDKETVQMLIVSHGKTDPKNKEAVKPFFRLNPPKKGYGRKGVKKSFSQKGALGNRGKQIIDLIKRML